MPSGEVPAPTSPQHSSKGSPPNPRGVTHGERWPSLARLWRMEGGVGSFGSPVTPCISV